MTQQDPARLGILISGRGSNLQAFIDACGSGEIAAQISIVISNNPEAAGLQRAAAAGIRTCCIDHRAYIKREDFDRALVEKLQEHDAELIILAGFMRILTPVFINAFAGRLMNIHPSLMPRYPGLNTHQRALDAGDSHAGVTVHFVTQELDGGPPIIHAPVPILPTDTAQSLAARVIVQEHIIYPIAVRWYLEGRVVLTDSGALLDGKAIAPTGIAHTTE